MRTREGLGMSAAILVAVAGVGCGARDGAPPSSSANETTSSPASTTPTPPNPSPPNPGWWQVNPEPTPITYETPACVPVSPPTGRRYPHPCITKAYGPDGSLSYIQTLDAAGKELGVAAFSRGSKTTSFHSTYDALGRKIRDDYYYGETTSAYGYNVWTYDPAGRMVLIDGGSTYHWYLYDEQGRLSWIEHFTGQPIPVTWSHNLYTSQGGLARTVHAARMYCPSGPSAADPDCGLYISDDFTFHPNGQVKHEHYDHRALFDQNTPSSWDKEYDEQGHQISAATHAREGESSTAWTYDGRGRRVEEHLQSSSASDSADQHTGWLYDDAGQPGARRIVNDWTHQGGSPASGEWIKTDRFYYACGSEELLFREQDTDQDGVRDGWYELIRDAAGNLRVEAYHGSLIQESSISRMEYDYSCFE